MVALRWAARRGAMRSVPPARVGTVRPKAALKAAARALLWGRMTPPAALLVVPDGAALSWQRVVAGYGHAAPLGRLYIFFEVRSASDASARRCHATTTTDESRKKGARTRGRATGRGRTHPRA
jgi:hypothetical protein